MLFYLNKIKNVLILIGKMIPTFFIEHLSNIKLYRRLSRKNWYFVCLLDTGDEIWIDYKPPIELALIIKEEKYV